MRGLNKEVNKIRDRSLFIASKRGGRGGGGAFWGDHLIFRRAKEGMISRN